MTEQEMINRISNTLIAEAKLQLLDGEEAPDVAYRVAKAAVITVATLAGRFSDDDNHFNHILEGTKGLMAEMMDEQRAIGRDVGQLLEGGIQ